MKYIDIGEDYTNTPAGRFYKDKNNKKGSGEEFRETMLLPALSSLDTGEKLTVIIDNNVEGYGSSFLSEGFAGVVKYGHMDSHELLEKLIIQYTDPDFEFFKNRILEYIKNSSFASEQYQSTKTSING